MKQIIISFITLCLACSSSNKISKLDECNAKLEKGVFLYEINVPDYYFIVGDAIASSPHIIKFTENKNELLDSYRKNIYYEGNPNNRVNKFIGELKKYRCYDISVEEFSEKSFHFDDDFGHYKYDGYYWIGNKAYLKFYAEFFVIDVGLIDEMIPKLENYKCCSSFTNEKVNGKMIIKVQEFKILPPTGSDIPQP